jgi:hypothetical protein
MSRTSRPFAAWFIMFSLLLNGLMPLVAHATATTRFASMAICSNAADKSEAPAKPTSHPHCAYCCTGLDGSPLPSDAANYPTFIAASFASPQPASTTPRIASIAGIAQSRAPPFGS